MAKHKYIETPEKMWELFQAYKKSVKDNPRTKVEYVGKDGIKVSTPLVTPLTMEGFEEYVVEHTAFTYPDLSDYFENKDDRYKEYIPIIMRVRKQIRQDQIEGGMVGQYNSNLTARLNGLTDKQEHTTITNPPIFPDID